MADITLRQARELVGLTQVELARRAGVDHSTVSDLERGKNLRPSHELVVRLVRALKASGLQGITGEQLFPVPDQPRDGALA